MIRPPTHLSFILSAAELIEVVSLEEDLRSKTSDAFDPRLKTRETVTTGRVSILFIFQMIKCYGS